MKKKIIIIVAVIVVLFGGYLAWEICIKDFVEDIQHNNNRINNCKTLSQYVEYHDWGYTDVTQDIEDSLSFYAKDIKCDILKDNNIKYLYDTFDNIILVLNDNTMYKTAFMSDKLFSNGQQYMQIGTDIKFKRIQKQEDSFLLISEDNNYYKIENGEIKKFERIGIYNNSFIEDENIVKIRGYYKTISDGKSKKVYLTLKTDGQIYEQEYEIKYNSTGSTTSETILKKETVLFSNEDYGHITDFFYSGTNLGGNNNITRIVSDKGLFYLKQINDQQYIDTEPVYAMVQSDIYNKYKKDIIYIDSNLIFTSDNNIIQTDMLCKDIDKDVLSDKEIAKLNSTKKIEIKKTTNEPIIENSNDEKTENGSTNDLNSQTNENNTTSNNKDDNKTENKENTTNTNNDIENNKNQETEKEEKFITIKNIWMENDGGKFSVGDKVIIHAIVDSKYKLTSRVMAVISDINSASKHADQVSVIQNDTEYHFVYHLNITDEFIPGLWHYQCSIFQDIYNSTGDDTEWIDKRFYFSFTVI